jgi:hypothetical protein
VFAEDKYLQAALREFMGDVGEDIKNDLLSYPKRDRWRHEVKVNVEVNFFISRSGQVVVQVDDELYAFVDQGTKRHWVRPRYRKALRWIDKKSGAGPFFSKGHVVRGIRARHWTRYVQKRWDKKLAVEYQKILDVYARQSKFAA